MQSYRMYLLDESDHIKSFVELWAISDSDAIEHAKRYGRFQRRPVEVWRGREMIFRDPNAEKPERGSS